MDCIDCHNRPTHIYVPPDLVGRQVACWRAGSMATLPYIKQQAVTAITGKYDTTDAAMQGIAKSLHEFYASKYPDLAKSKELEIRNAIDEVQRIFRSTVFPEMKVDWQTHPNNIGHFYSRDASAVTTASTSVPKARPSRRIAMHATPVMGQQEGDHRHRFGSETLFHPPRGSRRPYSGELQRLPLRGRRPLEH